VRVRIRRFVVHSTIGGSVQRYFSVLASASRHCLGLHSLQVTWPSAMGFSRLPCILAPFTAPALDCIGPRCLVPTRPTGTASYGVRIPQVAGLLPASSRPRLTATPLPSANGWCNTGPLRGAVRVNPRKGLSPSSQRPCWAHTAKPPVCSRGLCFLSPE
jgi:hypothetical protein